jgi:Fur family peroxide stress response transcriptional regulator
MPSHPSDSSIIQALRNRRYKATSQRIAICRFALGSRDHPSAQTIYRQIKKMHPTVSLATVYKTLHVLKELRLLQELSLPQRQTRFDSYVKPHLNLVCLQCGNIRDVDHRRIQEIVAGVAGRAGFTVTGQRLDMYGICKRCGGRGKP